jgi:addiction module HigA family antidote
VSGRIRMSVPDTTEDRCGVALTVPGSPWQSPWIVLLALAFQEVSIVTVVAPIHPGEVLMEEFLEPLGVTQHRLAVQIGVPPRRISEIVHGKRRVTANTDLRLARYFGTTDRFWLNLQTRFDIETEKDNLGAALEAITPLHST